MFLSSILAAVSCSDPVHVVKRDENPIWSLKVSKPSLIVSTEGCVTLGSSSMWPTFQNADLSTTKHSVVYWWNNTSGRQKERERLPCSVAVSFLPAVPPLEFCWMRQEIWKQKKCGWETLHQPSKETNWEIRERGRFCRNRRIYRILCHYLVNMMEHRFQTSAWWLLLLRHVQFFSCRWMNTTQQARLKSANDLAVWWNDRNQTAMFP